MLAFSLLTYFLVLIYKIAAQQFDAGYSCVDPCVNTLPAGITTCPDNDVPCFCEDSKWGQWFAKCVGLSCPAADFEPIANSFSQLCLSYGVSTTALSVSQFVDDAESVAPNTTSSSTPSGTSPLA